MHACSIASQAAPGALAPKQVEIASENDTTLKLVRDAITIVETGVVSLVPCIKQYQINGGSWDG